MGLYRFYLRVPILPDVPSPAEGSPRGKHHDYLLASGYLKIKVVFIARAAFLSRSLRYFHGFHSPTRRNICELPRRDTSPRACVNILVWREERLADLDTSRRRRQNVVKGETSVTHQARGNDSLLDRKIM